MGVLLSFSGAGVAQELASGESPANLLERLNAQKSHVLEIRFGSSASAFKESGDTSADLKPTQTFLDKAHALAIGVGTVDSGWVRLEGRTLGYSVKKQDDGRFILTFAQADPSEQNGFSMHTQVVLEPGNWQTLGGISQTIAGGTESHDYTVIRISD
jgi:hypothetical protein